MSYDLNEKKLSPETQELVNDLKALCLKHHVEITGQFAIWKSLEDNVALLLGVDQIHAGGVQMWGRDPSILVPKPDYANHAKDMVCEFCGKQKMTSFDRNDNQMDHARCVSCGKTANEPMPERG